MNLDITNLGIITAALPEAPPCRARLVLVFHKFQLASYLMSVLSMVLSYCIDITSRKVNPLEIFGLNTKNARKKM